MTTEPDPLATMAFESSMAATIIAQGAIVGFLSVVGVAATVIRGASWSFVVLGAVLSVLLLAAGAWLWRRSKRASARRLGSRLVFWWSYAPLCVISGLSFLTARSWPRFLLFAVVLSLATWFCLRVALRPESE